ncbi:bifunctional folylpolyglutamate synthase/dihydrofolate synthase [Calditrichota bacterium GD2]
MKYAQAVREIYALQEFAIKLGLENISALSSRLGNPHLKYPVIHLAGTNGKGSTAFFIHALLQAHGLKSGLFTSPHLSDYRERIRVNDEFISKDFIAEFWLQNKDFILQKKATFFDTSTAMAFKYFADMNVDVAVIETGLGGRLDSTNIVRPQMVVLTPIDFDHQKQLGNTLASIAREKAGIIKNGAPVFCAPQNQEALTVFLQHIQRPDQFNYLTDLAAYRILESSLDGMRFEVQFKKTSEKHCFRTSQAADFQAQNITLALVAGRAYLESQGLAWSEVKTQQALLNGLWPGRLQTVRKVPRVIFDVSHNPAGIISTLSFVKRKAPEHKIHLLIGLLEHKDHKEVVNFLSRQNMNIYLTEPQSIKKLAVGKLADAFIKKGKSVHIYPDPLEAVQKILNRMKKDELLIVMGSHYLIGYLINEFSGNPEYSFY